MCIYLCTHSIFINMKISLSTVSRHLVSKSCLILFREQNIFRKKPLHLLIFYQLQLIFSMENLTIQHKRYSFCIIFDSFFMEKSQKLPLYSTNSSFKRWIIFLKNYHSHPEGHQCPNELKWLLILFYGSKSHGNWCDGL